MNQHISTSFVSFFGLVFKDILVSITSLIEERSQLALALTCSQLFVRYNTLLKHQEYILLCHPQFNANDHSRDMEMLERDWSSRTGWNRTKANIKVCSLNDVSDSECLSVSGICLKAPFDLTDEILKHAMSINHVSLEFLEENIASSISFLKNFPNLVSVWLLGARFNDDMLKTISNCPLLYSLLLHNCKMDHYLSEMAKICTIKNVHLSRCTQAETITLPLQCERANIEFYEKYEPVNLSVYTLLSHL
jgi:hypothetical protein